MTAVSTGTGARVGVELSPGAGMGTPSIVGAGAGVLLLIGAGAGVLLLWPGAGVGARVVFCSLGAEAGVGLDTLL